MVSVSVLLILYRIGERRGIFSVPGGNPAGTHTCCAAGTCAGPPAQPAPWPAWGSRLRRSRSSARCKGCPAAAWRWLPAAFRRALTGCCRRSSGFWQQRASGSWHTAGGRFMLVSQLDLSTRSFSHRTARFLTKPGVTILLPRSVAVSQFRVRCFWRTHPLKDAPPWASPVTKCHGLPFGFTAALLTSPHYCKCMIQLANIPLIFEYEQY